MELLGVQRRYVPHLKGLISTKVDLEAQGRDSTFTFRHTLLKKAILHLKRAKGVHIFFRDCSYLDLLIGRKNCNGLSITG